MKPTRRLVQPRAVSEASLAAALARATGVDVRDTVDAVRIAAMENNGLTALFGVKWVPYQWAVPVADFVMADRPAGLASDVLAAPDNVFLVKSSTMKAGRDLFLVWSGNPGARLLKGIPFRGLVNHMDVGGELERITAIQLSSCLR